MCLTLCYPLGWGGVGTALVRSRRRSQASHLCGRWALAVGTLGPATSPSFPWATMAQDARLIHLPLWPLSPRWFKLPSLAWIMAASS